MLPQMAHQQRSRAAVARGGWGKGPGRRRVSRQQPATRDSPVRRITQGAKAIRNRQSAICNRIPPCRSSHRPSSLPSGRATSRSGPRRRSRHCHRRRRGQGVVAGAAAGRLAGGVHGHRRRADPDARPPAAQSPHGVAVSAARRERPSSGRRRCRSISPSAASVNPAQLDRAVQLSRDKYCSVWHSMREDITLETTTSIDPAA